MTEKTKVRVKVIKVGGKPIGTIERVNAVADAVEKEREAGFNVVVVVSAQMDETDELDALARQIDEDPDPLFLDGLLNGGEMKTVYLLAMALRKRKVPVTPLDSHLLGIHVEGKHTKAHMIDFEHGEALTDPLSRGDVIVLPGFQGLMKSGHLATTGRGGSDRTAIATAVHIKEFFTEHEEPDAEVIVELWKDVDGVFTADPRIVPDAIRLEEVINSRMVILAQLGSGVVMDAALIIAMANRIPIHVLLSPSFGQSTGGTKIVPGSSAKNIEGDLMRPFTALTFERFSQVRIAEVPDEPGALAKILEAIASIGHKGPVQNEGKGGLANVSFLVTTKKLDNVLAALEALDNLKVESTPSVVNITLIDPRMQDDRMMGAFSARMARALASVGVNIRMGTPSPNSLTFVVNDEDLYKAANAVAQEFDLTTAPKQA